MTKTARVQTPRILPETPLWGAGPRAEISLLQLLVAVSGRQANGPVGVQLGRKHISMECR